MKAILHYIHDPLCGWCYGAEPLVDAALGIAGLELELHGGGLWPEPTRLPESTRDYIREADARVGAMSGQPYGDAYLNGLLADPTMTLESRPTTAAVLAAESLGQGLGFAMLKGIQHAHYERGLRVVEPDVLKQIAIEIGLTADAFDEALANVDPEAHISSSRRLMTQIGAQGFPTFALQLGERWFGVSRGEFSSNPPAFADYLERMIKAGADA